MGAESSQGFPTSKVLLREIVLLDCSTNSNTALIDRTGYISLVTDLTHIYGKQIYSWPVMLANFSRSAPITESINSTQNLNREKKKGQQDLSF